MIDYYSSQRPIFVFLDQITLLKQKFIICGIIHLVCTPNIVENQYLLYVRHLRVRIRVQEIFVFFGIFCLLNKLLIPLLIVMNRRNFQKMMRNSRIRGPTIEAITCWVVSKFKKIPNS